MSKEGIFLVVYYVSFILQIIKHMSLVKTEDAVRDETDMVTIHSRTPSVAREWTDGHMVNQNEECVLRGKEPGAEIGRGPQRLYWRMWKWLGRAEAVFDWRFTVYRATLWS